MRREVEVKFRFRSEQDHARLRTRALDVGFQAEGRMRQLDFVPDTADYACRQSGLLLRLRETRHTGGSATLVVTLKVSHRPKYCFQDTEELEFYVGSKEGTRVLDDMNAILEATRVGFELPSALSVISDFRAIYMLLVKETGLTARRALIEKIRVSFYRNDCILFFDTLPAPLGRYVELESDHPGTLSNVIEELGLQHWESDSRFYATILQSLQPELPEAKQRTCLFLDTERRLRWL